MELRNEDHQNRTEWQSLDHHLNRLEYHPGFAQKTIKHGGGYIMWKSRTSTFRGRSLNERNDFNIKRFESIGGGVKLYDLPTFASIAEECRCFSPTSTTLPKLSDAVIAGN
ncbi:unnamed protein product [Ceratitis capitata]|uniref:(Mediterranean fruit fly) hypothetical protein n=1 Tax=Ceratitis capitata TaxID=7213 RepID=A0A811UV02_CERCA|nr:unnamed protein product [Ceratitis capitata]